MMGDSLPLGLRLLLCKQTGSVLGLPSLHVVGFSEAEGARL